MRGVTGGGEQESKYRNTFSNNFSERRKEMGQQHEKKGSQAYVFLTMGEFTFCFYADGNDQEKLKT